MDKIIYYLFGMFIFSTRVTANQDILYINAQLPSVGCNENNIDKTQAIYLPKYAPLVHLLPIAFLLYQALEVGLMDALEFKYFNRQVFYEHNFPDILGVVTNHKFKLGSGAAFVSGLKCCIPLVMPCLVKNIALYIRKPPTTRRLFKIHAVLAGLLITGDIITLATFDQSIHSIYRNHELFYKLHICTEVISMVACIFC